MPPTIAEQLIGDVSSGIDQTGANIGQGAQLAQHVANIQQQRAQIDQQREQLQFQKISKYGDLLETASRLDPGPARTALLKSYIPNFKSAMGIDKLFPEQSQQILESEPALAPYLISKIHSGELTQPDLLAHAQDPEWLIKQLPEVKPFLAKENLGQTVSDYGKQISEADKFRITKEETRKNAETQAGMRFGQQDKNTADKQLSEFSNKVANASSRGNLGRAKQMVDAADSVTQLTNGAGLAPGAQPPANETREQRIARYNQMTSSQNAEVFKSLDRLLSMSNPTVHGMESLTPTTYEAIGQKYGEKLFNMPRGANLGEFIEKAMETVNRERNLNAAKFKNQAKALKSGNAVAEKVYGGRMDKIIEDTINNPIPAAAPAGKAFKDFTPNEQQQIIKGIKAKSGETEAQIRQRLGG